MTKLIDGIRVAEAKDEDAIYEHMLLNHEENGIFTVSEPKAREAIRLATQGKLGIIGLIDGEDGTIEASICLIIESWWYTDDYCLDEKWLFVRQDCRRKNHASRLTDFAKHCRKELCKSMPNLNLPLFIGVLATERTEAKVRLYRRKFPCYGAFFMEGLERPALQRVRDGGR